MTESPLESPYDARNGRVAWCWMPFRDGEFLHFPVNGGDRGPWALDGEIAGKPDQMVREVQPAPVVAWQAGETGKTFGPVTREPTLQCSFARRAGAGEVREGDAVDQMRLKNAIALDRQGRDERRMRHRRAPTTIVRKTQVCLPIDMQIRSRCQTGQFDVNLPGKET